MHTDLAEVLRIAERRRNLVTRDELRAHGLTDRQIDQLVARAVIHRIRRSVYSTVAPPFDPEQQALALCLGIEGAVVAGATAAEHWGLRRAPKGRLEVTVPPYRKLRAGGALVRRSNRIPDHHVVATLEGLRVTSPARTLFDAGAWLDRRGHLSMVQDAREKRLVSDEELGEVYADLGGQGRKGSTAFRELMSDLPIGMRPTMSEYEERFAQALVEAGLPQPVRQHPVAMPGGSIVYLDLAILETLIDVEIDHTFWHAGITAMMKDRFRDNGLALGGWERLRFTDHDVDRRLRASVRMVQALHAHRLEVFTHLPLHLRSAA